MLLVFFNPHEVCNNGSLICYLQKNNFATDIKDQGIDKQISHIDFHKHLLWLTITHTISHYVSFFQPNLSYAYLKGVELILFYLTIFFPSI